MKRYFIAILLILLFSNFAEAQFRVIIASNKSSDTINTCKDTVITFYAYGVYNNDTLPDMNFEWDFDDQTIETNKNLDTVEHSFIGKKMYRVFVTVWNDTLRDYNTKVVRLGIDPSFEDTKVDIDAEQTGICKGDIVKLVSSVKPIEWKEKRTNSRIETFSQFITDEYKYSSYIFKRSYELSQKITDASDIDSIGIKLEHSNTSNIKITLKCPTGKEVILKNSGGVEKSFGEPILGADNMGEGVGYWYYWTNSPTYGTMNTYSAPHDTLPSGTYAPDEPFTKFIGCPLNGKWSILITDTKKDDHNGYVWAWSLALNNNLASDTIKYQNTYDIKHSVWSGEYINISTNGQSSAKPVDYGLQIYRYYIKDNYSCLHDTNASVMVEKPSFTADKEPPVMVIGDSIKLEDKTSWATSWSWDFGDETSLGDEKTVTKKYEYKGKYQVVMTVKTDNGCTDTDTTVITINPKPVEIVPYNIFSPNGDGVNDVFTFFNTPEEKIDAANIEEIKGRIYNRYGEVVCSWENVEDALKGWDGTINNKGGKYASPGFYYYVLLITSKEVDNKNQFVKQQPIKGTLYLYRSE